MSIDTSPEAVRKKLIETCEAQEKQVFLNNICLKDFVKTLSDEKIESIGFVIGHCICEMNMHLLSALETAICYESPEMLEQFKD